MLLIFLLLLFQQSYGNEISLTTTVIYSGNKWITPLILFKHNFQLEVINQTEEEENPAFPNKIKISNFFIPNPNANLSVVFPFILYFEGFDNFVECISINNSINSCEAAFPNGKLRWAFKVIGDATTTIFDEIGIFVHDGILYQVKDGTFFTLNSNCINYEDYQNQITQMLCCNDLNPLEIPNSDNTLHCKHFEANVKISDATNDFFLVFLADFFKLGKNWDIHMQIDEGPNFEYSFYFGPNNERDFCVGNNTVLYPTCLWENISENAIFEMIFTFLGENKISYEGVIVGEMIYAFGKYYKNLNIPYTVDDPCWVGSSLAIPFSKGTYDTSFCCTEFEDETTTSTSVETTSSTSTSTMTTSTSTETIPSSTNFEESLNTVTSTESPDDETTAVEIINSATTQSNNAKKRHSSVAIITSLMSFFIFLTFSTTVYNCF